MTKNRRPYRGWPAVLCLFVSWLCWSGILKCLGVMIPTLQDQSAAGSWLVGWIVAIVNDAACAVGPGLNFTSTLSNAEVGRWYTATYGTAVAIGKSGHSLALFAIAPFTQLLLNTYGWRGTMMILGGISFHLTVCSALLPPSKEYTQTGNYGYQALLDENKRISNSRNAAHQPSTSILSDTVQAMKKQFGFSILFKMSFWITAFISACSRFVADLWLIYFIAHAQAKGFSPYDAVAFTMSAGLGTTSAMLVFGFIVDRSLLKLRQTLILVIVIGLPTFFVTPWLVSYWPMMVNTFICCGSIGVVFSLNDVFVRETLGTELLVPAFSWIEVMVAICSLTFGYFPGWVYDQRGSYDLAFFIMGFVSMVPLLALILEWLLNRS